MTGAVQHPIEIGGHPAAPFIGIGFPKRDQIVEPRCRPGVARIVDQNIHAAKCGLRFGKRRANRVEIRDVEGERQSLCTRCLHFRGNAFGPFGVKIVDNDGTGSVFRQIKRDLPTNALPRSGYKCGTTFDGKQVTHLRSFLSQPSLPAAIVFDISIAFALARCGYAEIEFLDVLVVSELVGRAVHHDPAVLHHIGIVGDR